MINVYYAPPTVHRCTSRDMNSVYLSNVNESHRRCIFRIFPRVTRARARALLRIGKTYRARHIWKFGKGGNIARRNAIPRPRHAAPLNPISHAGEGRRALTAMIEARGTIRAASRMNSAMDFLRGFKRDFASVYVEESSESG